MEEINKEAAPKQGMNGWLKLIFGVLAVLLMVMGGAAAYFYKQYDEVKRSMQATKTDEVAELVSELSQVIELPTDETPTLATVTDKDKLREQAFFKKAENGDKIIIYTESGRAILYRPGSKKIIDVTTVSVKNEGDQSTDTAKQASIAEPENQIESDPSSSELIAQTSAENQPAKVVFLNGSTKVGVTQTAEDKLIAAYPDGGVVVMAKEKASKSDYVGTIVAPVTSGAAAKADQVALALGGTVGSLPGGETIPEGTDILVIIGNSTASAVATQ